MFDSVLYEGEHDNLQLKYFICTVCLCISPLLVHAL